MTIALARKIAAQDMGHTREELRRVVGELVGEVERLTEQSDYCARMGLSFGIMKTSDVPEGFLAHTWAENSGHERMFREWSDSIGWEHERDQLRAELAAASEREQRLRDEIEALTDCLNGSSKAVYTAEMYDKAKDAAYAEAEATIQASIASGGTSCHRCIDKTKRDAFQRGEGSAKGAN